MDAGGTGELLGRQFGVCIPPFETPATVAGNPYVAGARSIESVRFSRFQLLCLFPAHQHLEMAIMAVAMGLLQEQHAHVVAELEERVATPTNENKQLRLDCAVSN